MSWTTFIGANAGTGQPAAPVGPLEAILQSPIRLAGEPERSVDVSDVGVVVGNVFGRVAGVRTDLAKLKGDVSIRGVDVETKDVGPGGQVECVDPTGRYQDTGRRDRDGEPHSGRPPRRESLLTSSLSSV